METCVGGARLLGGYLINALLAWDIYVEKNIRVR